MTVLGKILVLFNFIAALVLLAMFALMHFANDNWFERYKRTKEERDIAQAQLQDALNEPAKIKAEAEKRNKELDADLQDTMYWLIALNDTLKDRDQQIETLKHQRSQGLQNDQSLTIANERHHQEVKALEASVERLRKGLEEAIFEKSKLQQDKTDADVRTKALQFRLKNMQETMEQMVKDFERERHSTAGAVTGGRPLQNVEGLVKLTDGDRFVTITIGSDAGIAEGHTLQVFRLTPNVRDSKYLGTVKILVVHPHESVGEVDRTAVGKVRIGDRVGTSITNRSS